MHEGKYQTLVIVPLVFNSVRNLGGIHLPWTFPSTLHPDNTSTLHKRHELAGRSASHFMMRARALVSCGKLWNPEMIRRRSQILNDFNVLTISSEEMRQLDCCTESFSAGGGRDGGGREGRGENVVKEDERPVEGAGERSAGCRG